MKQKIERFFKRMFIVFKEIINILTNFLVPFASLVVAILEILPVPMQWVKMAKTAEYWLFQFAGTAKDIEKIIEDKAKELPKK